MNSKSSVLFAFTAWTVLCSLWYVCHIKELCGNRVAPPVEMPAAELPEPIAAPDSHRDEPPAATPAPQPVAEAPRPVEHTAKTESVQVEEVGDDATIHFPYNSTDKEANGGFDDYLDRLAQNLVATHRHVTISGHTDGIGDAATNVLFSERRAKNIRDILLKKGVSRAQITTKGFGESNPVATNDTPEGRYKNRRVVVQVSN